jgi:AcrR family transcriptional regulator
MVAAAVELTREHGYRGLDVDEVVARAKVSRRAFYDLLETREACLVLVLEETVKRVARAVREALQTVSSPSWQVGVRAALETVLAFVATEPNLACALIVDALTAGPNVLAYRTRVLESVTTLLNAAPTHRSEGKLSEEEEPLPLTAEWAVAGVLGIIQSRLVSADASPPSPGRGTPEELVNPLMALTVLAYAGRGAAVAELHRPVGEVKRTWAAPAPDPLANLGMRITHRRLLVLGAIAENPGASSRDVADKAGIENAGQASKLLARLVAFGLIENIAQGRGSGQAKAWRLTGLGQEVWRGLRGRG